MPTRPKPVTVLKAENKSHRTKKELALRSAGEKALATGKPFKVRKEVKENKIAYKEYKRVSELLEIIGKNDALIEGSVNRYCELTAEIIDLEAKKEEFSRGITELQTAYEQDAEENPVLKERVIPVMEYFNTLSRMEAALLALDKRIQDKRKMLLDIEKENIMTIAAQLRSIPKKVEDEEEADSMAKLFKARGA